MGFIDFVLNLAGLLLWMNWRSERLDATLRVPVISLAGALRRTGSSPIQRWRFLIWLGVLLGFRPLIYWQLGGAVQQVFLLDFAVVSVPFRCERFGPMLFYSLASFGLALAFLYFALLLLALLNRRLPEGDPMQRFVRVHLGPVDRLPVACQWLLPGFIGTLAWMALCPVFASQGIVPKPPSFAALWQQSVVVGLGAYLQWRWVIIAVLLLHFANTYAYLGHSPVWTYVQNCGKNLLRPLDALPLRTGKVDFAPLIGVGLVFLTAQALESGWGWKWEPLQRGVLPWLYSRVPF